MREKDKVNFFGFLYVWFKMQRMGVPKHQRRMADWLENLYAGGEGKRQGLLMSFRNSGKSTVVGLFCAWILYRRSSDRILVAAADYELAGKMVRNVKRIIERHPLTKNYRPQKTDQWASDRFTIVRELELRDPSMLAKGLDSNFTGTRAEIVICDDVEVPNTCATSAKRADMREKLSELDYVLTPGGMQLYVGTPHSFYTIYRTEVAKDKPEEKPFLQGFEKLEIPILDRDGNSVWPERFSNEKIASIRSRSGENKFLSQMMLKPVDIRDSRLDPSRLNAYDAKLQMFCANGREVLKLGDRKLVSASCWWDPSFGGTKGDGSVIACVFTDGEGRYCLHDIEYIKTIPGTDENAASAQCEKAADFLERNFLPSIRVEANGIGRFLPGILKQVLKRRNMPVAVLEVFSSRSKEKRILEAFEVLLAERALDVNVKIWQTPFIGEMRGWSVEGSAKDDALDAVAGCLLSEPVRFGGQTTAAAKQAKRNWQGSGEQFAAAVDFNV